MQAKLTKKKDIVVVNLSGRIDVEYSEPFRDACIGTLAQRSDKIVFNMKELSFVGSNGIMPFVKAIHELAKQNPTLKFCQVGSEFKKIFAASPLRDIEIFESEEKAVLAFDDGDEPQEA